MCVVFCACLSIAAVMSVHALFMCLHLHTVSMTEATTCTCIHSGGVLSGSIHVSADAYTVVLGITLSECGTVVAWT